MANINCNGKIEAKELNIANNVDNATISFNSNSSIEEENGAIKMSSSNFLFNGVDLLSKLAIVNQALTIDAFYVDLIDNGNTANATSANYIKIGVPGNKQLIIVWGTSPDTNGDGFLRNAPSGVGWVPTTSTGQVCNFFTSPGQYRVTATPYGGTQYAYGWRVVNYLKSGYGGFNIRYGNTTSGIRFSYIMVGIVDKI